MVGVVFGYVWSVGVLGEHQNTQTCIETLLHTWHVLRHTFCLLAYKHVILLILLYHQLGVGQTYEPVVKCLLELVVGIPHLDVIKVGVSLNAKPFYCSFGVGKLSCIVWHSSCLVTVLEYLDHTYTAERCNARWLYDNIKAVYGVHAVWYGA